MPRNRYADDPDDAHDGGRDEDRDLPQEIDLDPDDDLGEAPSEECDRCGREYYGEFCPACGPEGGPDHQPKAWVRLVGLVLVFAFVIAFLSLVR